MQGRIPGRHTDELVAQGMVSSGATRVDVYEHVASNILKRSGLTLEEAKEELEGCDSIYKDEMLQALARLEEEKV